MGDMFDNLRRTGSITRSADNSGHGKKCEHCHNEPASGTVRNSDGKWTRVGRSCKRAMGVKRQKVSAKDRAKTGRHNSGEVRNQSDNGRHRAD